MRIVSRLLSCLILVLVTATAPARARAAETCPFITDQQLAGAMPGTKWSLISNQDGRGCIYQGGRGDTLMLTVFRNPTRGARQGIVRDLRHDARRAHDHHPMARDRRRSPGRADRAGCCASGSVDRGAVGRVHPVDQHLPLRPARRRHPAQAAHRDRPAHDRQGRRHQREIRRLRMAHRRRCRGLSRPQHAHHPAHRRRQLPDVRRRRQYHDRRGGRHVPRHPGQHDETQRRLPACGVARARQGCLRRAFLQQRQRQCGQYLCLEERQAGLDPVRTGQAASRIRLGRAPRRRSLAGCSERCSRSAIRLTGP